jgi:hypothetical protein
MTEAEWLACQYPARMLEALLGRSGGKRLRALLRPRASDRKLRLLGCAAARALPFLANPEKGQRLREAIEVAERFADGAASREELGRARRADGPWVVALHHASQSAEGIADSMLRGRKALLLGFLRCIFANPFRPVTLEPAWRTPTAVSLAQAAYDDRILPSGELDRDRLAVLADALEDAGCTNPDILDHLRGRGPHVRGCWALDLVLGRE